MIQIKYIQGWSREKRELFANQFLATLHPDQFIDIKIYSGVTVIVYDSVIPDIIEFEPVKIKNVRNNGKKR